MRAKERTGVVRSDLRQESGGPDHGTVEVYLHSIDQLLPHAGMDRGVRRVAFDLWLCHRSISPPRGAHSASGSRRSPPGRPNPLLHAPQPKGEQNQH